MNILKLVIGTLLLLSYLLSAPAFSRGSKGTHGIIIRGTDGPCEPSLLNLFKHCPPPLPAIDPNSIEFNFDCNPGGQYSLQRIKGEDGGYNILIAGPYGGEYNYDNSNCEHSWNGSSVYFTATINFNTLPDPEYKNVVVHCTVHTGMTWAGYIIMRHAVVRMETDSICTNNFKVHQDGDYSWEVEGHW